MDNIHVHKPGTSMPMLRELSSDRRIVTAIAPEAGEVYTVAIENTNLFQGREDGEDKPSSAYNTWRREVSARKTQPERFEPGSVVELPEVALAGKGHWESVRDFKSAGVIFNPHRGE